MKKILLGLFFILIGLPVILPFFHAGYFPTHDGEWAVVRLGDMFRTLRDFQIPARYSGNLNFGYGYPLFNFAYPFPYYFGVIFHFLGLSFVNTIKILFASSVVFSAFFMFLASKALWKNNWAGIISATLYVYFPYRMVDLFVRGSIGESLSFALFPLLFYLAIRLLEKPSFSLIFWIAVSTGVLILTHNIMTVLFMPLFVMFVLLQAIIKNKIAVKPFLVSILLGVGISAFFWIPAIFEKSNILLSQTPIADRSLYFVRLDQFVFPRWGYGIPTDPNGFSYQLGLVHLVVFIAAVSLLLFILIKRRSNLKELNAKSAIVLTVAVIFYIFLLFKPSEFLWEFTPLLSEINYPWIALGILGFIISLLSGFLSRQTAGRYAMIALGIIAILIVSPYAKPSRYISNPDSYYLTNQATTTSSNELMPLWVKEFPLQGSKEKVEIVNGSGAISDLVYSSKKVSFLVNSLDRATVRINVIYYPGWKISVDKIDTKISYNNNQGVMEILASPGLHVVRASFGETPLRGLADSISLLTVVILIVLIIKRNKYAIS